MPRSVAGAPLLRIARSPSTGTKLGCLVPARNHVRPVVPDGHQNLMLRSHGLYGARSWPGDLPSMVALSARRMTQDRTLHIRKLLSGRYICMRYGRPADSLPAEA